MRHLTRDRERGAAIVEMAFAAPFLLILLLGIVEFGWAFSQFQDVRHGAREAARLAAVNAASEASMAATACSMMEVSSGQTVDFDLPAGTAIGSIARVRVQAPLETLTNFGPITVMLPGTLESEIDFRLEQPATRWTGGAAASC
jgi:Flp pilus assembly protein TadG